MAVDEKPRIILLKIDEVGARVGLGKSTIFKLVARGEFPKPLHVTSKAVRWRSDTIDQWIENLTT